MNKGLYTIVALAGLSLATPGAWADSVDVKFDGASPRSKLKINFNGNHQRVTAGVMNWTDLDNSSQNYETFCIDLEHYVRTGSNYNFDVVDLTQARSDAPTGGQLSDNRANLIELFWGQHRDDVVDNNTAAAFQAGIWELVYDGDSFGNAFDFDGGVFNAARSANTWSITTNWLENLDLQGPRQTLAAWTSDGVQDQILAVPTPSAIGAGLVMLGGVVWFRRRRRAG